MKELAANIAKALSKKVDKSDIRKTIRELNADTTNPRYVGDNVSSPDSVSNENVAENRRSRRDTAGENIDMKRGHNVRSKSTSSSPTKLSTSDVTRELKLLKSEIDKITHVNTDHAREIRQLQSSLLSEIDDLKSTIAANKKLNTANMNIANSSLQSNDLRVAMGDLSLNLRREMSEKCGREELQSILSTELNLIQKRITVHILV